MTTPLSSSRRLGLSLLNKSWGFSDSVVGLRTILKNRIEAVQLERRQEHRGMLSEVLRRVRSPQKSSPWGSSYSRHPGLWHSIEVDLAVRVGAGAMLVECKASPASFGKSSPEPEP